MKSAAALGTDPEDFLRHAMERFPQAVWPRLLFTRRLLQEEREDEAYDHLLFLDQQGVAEAAYCLGVSVIRRDNLPEALKWMERALAINPGHTETEAQVAALRTALVSPDATSLGLEQALTQIAADMGLDAKLLLQFAREDGIGGYGAENGAPQWPGGSVWEVEGQALYALVRALKPKTIVEVGSLVGCSTSHLALACKKNGRGEVYAVDPAADLSRVDPTLRKHIKPVLEDVFTWEPPEKVDLLFEDGAHEPGFTGGVLDKLRPRLKSGALAICHDYFQRKHGPHVAEEFDQAFGEAARSVLIQPSNCGLGYAVVQ
jgi:predicted O-methyltransferase YrrM